MIIIQYKIYGLKCSVWLSSVTRRGETRKIDLSNKDSKIIQ